MNKHESKTAEVKTRNFVVKQAGKAQVELITMIITGLELECLNRVQPSLMLLITPVLVLPRDVKTLCCEKGLKVLKKKGKKLYKNNTVALHL